MAKHIPPSPTSQTSHEKHGTVGKGTQDEPEHRKHALTHEDGDAETSGADAPPATDDADEAHSHEAKQSLARDAQTAHAVEQRDPKWLGASAPKRDAAGGSGKDSASVAGGQGYAPEIAHGKESGYGPADAAPGAHPRFGRQSAYGPHDDYAGHRSGGSLAQVSGRR